jgi:TonB family protein
VSHNPLPDRVLFHAGFYRTAMLVMGLMLPLMTSPWPQPALAQAQAQAQDGRKAKFSVQPAYPELARKNNIQGSARLQVVVAADGSIKDIKVLGGSPVLVQAAVDAVKKWKYETASAESTVILKFDFKP